MSNSPKDEQRTNEATLARARRDCLRILDCELNQSMVQALLDLEHAVRADERESMQRRESRQPSGSKDSASSDSEWRALVAKLVQEWDAPGDETFVSEIEHARRALRRGSVVVTSIGGRGESTVTLGAGGPHDDGPRTFVREPHPAARILEQRPEPARPKAKCPDCKGTGWKGGQGPPQDHSIVEMSDACSTCGGSCFVEAGLNSSAAREALGLDQKTMDEAWASACRQIRSAGEDVATLIRRAAQNIEAATPDGGPALPGLEVHRHELHGIAVELVEQIGARARAEAIEECAKVIGKYGDELWEQGLKDASTRVHHARQRVEQLIASQRNKEGATEK